MLTYYFKIYYYLIKLSLFWEIANSLPDPIEQGLHSVTAWPTDISWIREVWWGLEVNDVLYQTIQDRAELLNWFFEQWWMISSKELYEEFKNLFEKHNLPFPTMADIWSAISSSWISVSEAKVVWVNFKKGEWWENIISVQHYFKWDNFAIDLAFNWWKWIISENSENKQIRESVINSVFEDLKSHEWASWDTTWAAATLKYWLTVNRYNIIKAETGNPNISQEDAIRYYLWQLYDIWMKKEWFNHASARLRQALLDSSYNIWGWIFNYWWLSRELWDLSWLPNANLRQSALAESEVIKVWLLDTAAIEWKASLWLAKRRAMIYNKVAPSDMQIVKVEVLDTWKVIYWWDWDNNEIFSYIPKSKTVHASSAIGVLDVPKYA